MSTANKKTRVLVVCPECALVYHQWVTGAYIGPRKKCRKNDSVMQAMASAVGQLAGRDAWYGLMRCTSCSLRLCPPALRERLEKWLLHGEEI